MQPRPRAQPRSTSQTRLTCKATLKSEKCEVSFCGLLFASCSINQQGVRALLSNVDPLLKIPPTTYEKEGTACIPLHCELLS